MGMINANDAEDDNDDVVSMTLTAKNENADNNIRSGSLLGRDVILLIS